MSEMLVPVEFDASWRALVALEGCGPLAGGELDGARVVLRVAACVCLVAFTAALGHVVCLESQR